MDKNLFIAATILYGVTLIAMVTKSSKRFSTLFFTAGILAHLGGLYIRTLSAHHPPFTNLYETLLVLSLLTVIRLIISEKNIISPLRQLLLFFVIIIMVTIHLLPASFRAVHPLPPALNSFWMYIHIPVYLCGYMALLLACFYALNILLSARSESSPEIVDLARRLNREVKLAFFLLNAGLITGAIWGFVSWGNYWSWDSKEVWALINILLLGFYFHLDKPRIYKKALIVILVIFSIVFTYFGVNFLLAGLHSYR